MFDFHFSNLTAFPFFVQVGPIDKTSMDCKLLAFFSVVLDKFCDVAPSKYTVPFYFGLFVFHRVFVCCKSKSSDFVSVVEVGDFWR